MGLPLQMVSLASGALRVMALHFGHPSACQPPGSGGLVGRGDGWYLAELLSVVVDRFLVVGQAIRASLVPWTGFAMSASELTAVELVVTAQNAYSDGYQSEHTLTVQLDAVGDEEDLGDAALRPHR